MEPPQPRSSSGERPSLVLNPPDDPAFEAAVEAVVDAGATDPVDVQARLRDRYPRAIVRRRDLAGEPVAVWYLYRDGHWVRSRSG